MLQKMVEAVAEAVETAEAVAEAVETVETVAVETVETEVETAEAVETVAEAVETVAVVTLARIVAIELLQAYGKTEKLPKNLSDIVYDEDDMLLLDVTAMTAVLSLYVKNVSKKELKTTISGILEVVKKLKPDDISLLYPDLVTTKSKKQTDKPYNPWTFLAYDDDAKPDYTTHYGYYVDTLADDSVIFFENLSVNRKGEKKLINKGKILIKSTWNKCNRKSAKSDTGALPIRVINTTKDYKYAADLPVIEKYRPTIKSLVKDYITEKQNEITEMLAQVEKI